MSALDPILGPRPRMTLVVEGARIVEIWVEGRAPLIAVRDYDWGETDPGASRDEDGVPFTDITWRGPAWALGLSLYPPDRAMTGTQEEGAQQVFAQSRMSPRLDVDSG